MGTAEEISAAAGILLSLGFSYIPGLSDRYNLLSPAQKRLVMLGLLAVVTLGIFGLSCWGAARDGLGLDVRCDRQGVFGLLRAFITALVANQAVFLISPPRRRFAWELTGGWDDSTGSF